jgi:hypothetical protein
MSDVSPTPPPDPTPDPFKDARGLNAIFGKRQGDGPPLWPFLIGAVVLIGTFGLRMQLATDRAAERDAAFEVSRMMANDRSGMGIGGPSLGGPSITRPPHGPLASLEAVNAKAQTVCKKLATCAGGTGTEPLVDDCIKQDMALAADVDGRMMLTEMLDGIIASCGEKPCSEFTACYFDRIKASSEGVIGKSAPVSPEDRARIMKLVCEVGTESPGRLPDLNSPTASAKAKELNALVNKVGPGAAADLMRDGIEACGAPSAASSASSASPR